MKRKIFISVDSKIYPLEAVHAAAYTFTDRAYVKISVKSSRMIKVTLAGKGKGGLNPAGLEGEFMNELLHHALRLKIAASNRKIREYIITRALLSAQPGLRQSGAGGEAAFERPGEPDERLEAEIEELLKEVEKNKQQ